MGRLDFSCKPTFNNISEEKRIKILSVAVNEFAYNGFENANINTIAKKAQVSVGSLYKYFDTKTDLFLTSVNYGIQNLEAVMESVIVSDEPIMKKLEKLIRIAIGYSRKDEVLIKLLSEADVKREKKSEVSYYEFYTDGFALLPPARPPPKRHRP